MTNTEKEDLLARIDDKVATVLDRLDVRLSGAVVELIQRFSHDIVDHAELVNRKLLEN